MNLMLIVIIKSLVFQVQKEQWGQLNEEQCFIEADCPYHSAGFQNIADYNVIQEREQRKCCWDSTLVNTEYGKLQRI